MASASDLGTALAAYDSICLAEMDAVSLMDRVDTKYVFSEGNLTAVLRNVADSYRVLEVEGLRRSPYETLYFDTPGLQSYHEHHNGKANRRKHRMRAYAATGAAFFEVKTKTKNGRTLKKRVPIPAIVETLGPESAALAASAAGAPLPLAPQIWTTFSRVTLVGRDAAERVTIDTDLSFSRGARSKSLRGVVIVEVKQERMSRFSAFRRALRGLGARPMRVSKYCLGSALLTPSLKHNAFKPKLLAIKHLTANEASR